MSNVIDQTNDAGFATLRVIVDQYPQLREMSKTAEMSEDEFAALPDDAFAWPAQRRFPIHNAEHTAISLGYRKHAGAVPAEVDHLLKTAASVYSIDAKMFSKPKPLEKIANSSTFLLQEKKRFLVKCAEDVPVAERVLYSRYKELPVNDRAEAMQNLVKVAAHYGVPLSPSTYKLAGFTLTSTQVLRDWVGARKEAARKMGDVVAEQAYEKLAAQYQNTEPVINDRNHQIKLAKLVQKLDEASGLDRYYGRSLPDPIQTVFNTEKIAADQVDVNGVLFNKSILGAIPLSFWEDTLGPEVAQEVAPGGVVDPELLAQVLPTLPQDLKAALVTQLAPYNR
jgi:hypothetical protein